MQIGLTVTIQQITCHEQTEKNKRYMNPAQKQAVAATFGS
jgi:hypothetical protein